MQSLAAEFGCRVWLQSLAAEFCLAEYLAVLAAAAVLPDGCVVGGPELRPLMVNILIPHSTPSSSCRDEKYIFLETFGMLIMEY